MEYTGERVILGPGMDELTQQEHEARYEWASPLVAGKKVLDIACGSGYGSLQLSRTASEAYGGDIEPEAIDWAGQHYKKENLHFQVMDATKLPFGDKEFDAVVSFETIEHVGDIGEVRVFRDEMGRVLKPGGRLILSTPNKKMTKYLGIKNPWHAKEFYKSELEELLKNDFSHIEWYGQRVIHKMGFFKRAKHYVYLLVRSLGLLGCLGKAENQQAINNKQLTINNENLMVEKFVEKKDYLYFVLVGRKRNK